MFGFFYNFFVRIKNSISLYTTAVDILFILLALESGTLETTNAVLDLKENYPSLFVNESEVAIAVLSSLVTGLISLMVFSFTMVMLLLHQTSNNFSPRLVPLLASKKFHQFVLGFYLGTIIFCLLLMHYAGPANNAFELPQFGIMLGELFGVTCLILFVFFIHSISRNIQIGRIMEDIKGSTEKAICNQLSNSNSVDMNEHVDIQLDHEVLSTDTGYYRALKEKKIVQFCYNNNIVVNVVLFRGGFVLEGDPVAKTNKKLNDKEYQTLLNFFVFHEEELIDEDYTNGLKQLSEIAVKALSPGINDPGTALKAIDYLALLIKKIMTAKPEIYYFDKKNVLRVIHKRRSLEYHINRYIGHIRLYGSQDIFTVLKIFDVYFKLIKNDHREEYLEFLVSAAADLANEANKNLSSLNDRKIANSKIEQLNSILPSKYSLKYL